MGTQHTAQICINGHVVTLAVDTNLPEERVNFCQECGSSTITKCESCSTDIRGFYDYGISIDYSYTIPKFCHNCGKPYPWTRVKISTTKELTQTLEELSIQEKQDLEKNIDDIIRDTPRTNLASLQFKDTLSKIGKGTADVLRDIVVGIASETAKKIILG